MLAEPGERRLQDGLRPPLAHPLEVALVVVELAVERPGSRRGHAEEVEAAGPPVEPVHARPTLASAIQIGNPVSYPKAVDAIRRYDGIVEQASESEIAEEAARADRTGLFNCPHTGVALAATRKLVERGTIRSSDRVVVISTAHGLKFVDFKVRYHEMRLEDIESRDPNPALELPADYATVRDRMLAEIERRFGA